MLVWQSDQLGVTQESTLTQILSLKGSRNQVTKSKTLQATTENQAESQVVQEPAMGRRHMVKSPSFCPRCQSEAALVASGFWCSSPMRKMRLKFLPAMQANQCPFLCSVVNMRDPLLRLWVICSRNVMMEFVFCFKSLHSPLLLVL